MRTSKWIGVVALALPLAIPGGLRAQPQFLPAFNALYGTAGSKLDTCLVCHTGAIPVRNPYGKAVEAKLLKGFTLPAALVAVQGLDSDKDGFKNLKEIRARTFPGNKKSHPKR